MRAVPFLKISVKYISRKSLERPKIVPTARTLRCLGIPNKENIVNESKVESEKYVLILTDTFRIEGYISVFTGVRLTDYMNESKAYVAVTDATVKDLFGHYLFRNEFMNVNSESIQIVSPMAQSEGA